MFCGNCEDSIEVSGRGFKERLCMMGGIELMCKWYVGVNDLVIFYYFVFEMCFL